ncbi:UbiA-like protein EboC [Zeaxanthinibacter enoshimensis]|uniref:4-hydroxybenzoate polyprenyltransferase n=1 Tax=Zeaxanthinibacter enoshimensis TaxID=392009 RepID=A0A4R6TJH2_9FLAO|nr:UbiA-like protein EboC [Zeaxanthinibacter enoshimensis]TDQ31014.1 4-hydroxybenzoate polyprenyltransferase [Zeaxanthinibacter enoshimensis]
MRAVLIGYARLMRPANLPTAAADILAGLAISGALFTAGSFNQELLPQVLLLVVSTVLLYAGGVVLNDVFDLETDLVERPERPIPSGLIPRSAAAIFGGSLLIGGILASYLANPVSGLVALALAVAILSYDGFSKKYAFLGPLNMGICRGLNLLLGISVAGVFNELWYCIIPILYIFAITLISRGEVHGNNKGHILWAAVLYAIVLLCVIYVVTVYAQDIGLGLIFSLLFAFLIYRPLFRAYKENSAGNIKKAVMAGVISLIVLDASLAIGFAPLWYAILILLLWPLAILLSKIFAVT